MHPIYRLVMGVVAAIFSQVAFSSLLVQADWRVTGDSLLAVNQRDGREWLSLTVTKGLSAREVTERLGTGHDFNGFRLASRKEVSELFLYTVGLTDDAFVAREIDELSEFFETVGETGSDLTQPHRATMGIVSEGEYPHTNYVIGALYVPEIGSYVDRNCGYGWNMVSGVHGAWLVRDGGFLVEEPTQILLASFALLLLFVQRSRRNVKLSDRRCGDT